MTGDKVEILSVKLLSEQRKLLDEFKMVANKLRLEFGWHYLLDLAWIASHMDLDNNRRVIDAGAGMGVMQWFLSNRGIDVLSVDRGSRANLPFHFRAYSPVQGLRPEDLASRLPTAAYLLKNARSRRVKLESLLPTVRPRTEARAEGRGTVLIYNQDLSNLTDLENNSIDAVVAVSALEHNTPEGLRIVVDEMLRVLKPGGRLLATLGAATTEDWFHEPSKGWNYTEDSLRDIFQLDQKASSNYAEHDQLFEELKNSQELREGLAGFYCTASGRGMPWGEWNPQYIPVGVCKVKSSV
ncbi:MAG: class I SAM-dependent methyltransferase [Chloroflexota bacterium]